MPDGTHLEPSAFAIVAPTILSLVLAACSSGDVDESGLAARMASTAGSGSYLKLIVSRGIGAVAQFRSHDFQDFGRDIALTPAPDGSHALVVITEIASS
jgi:hypothetical protein